MNEEPTETSLLDFAALVFPDSRTVTFSPEYPPENTLHPWGIIVQLMRGYGIREIRLKKMPSADARITFEKVGEGELFETEETIIRIDP